MRIYPNVSGREFNYLTILTDVMLDGKRVSTCKCRCGTIKKISTYHVINNKTKSCGCLQSELTTKKNLTHGKSKTPEFRIWQSMKYRCKNKTDNGYKNYGGRGIRVCQSWRESFQAFLTDMGRRPSRRYSIDRINNDGNYSCGHCVECKAKKWTANCQWATRKSQRINTRDAIYITYQNKKLPLLQWARKFKIYHTTIRSRLNKGLPLDLVFSKEKLKRSAYKQLTRNDVVKILCMYETGDYNITELADRFNHSHGCISYVVRRKTHTKQ